MANHFLENRRRIQKALYTLGFVERIDTTEYCILEEKNNAKGQLRELVIQNIPFESNNSYNNAWAVNLEKDNIPFAAPPSYRSAEKAIIFYTLSSFVVLIIEMKNTLKPYKGGLSEIQEKFKATISRLSLFLPIHIYQDDKYDNIEIKFIGIIAYNNDAVSSLLNRESDKELRQKDISKILLDEKREMFISDDFGHEHRVAIHFCQNTHPQEESMHIDLEQIFIDDNWDFPLASNSSLNCPTI